MSWLPLPNLHVFVVFSLVLTRVSGLVMTAPMFATPDVPAQVRALLAFALALLITPSQTAVAVAIPASVLGYLVVVGSELLIGLVLGLGVMILLSGVQVAGQLVGRTSGLSLADVFDPAAGESIPQLASLLLLVTTAVFVALGGHRILMAGLLDSFARIPPGGGLLGLALSETVETLRDLLTASFELGVRAGAPLLAAILSATLVTALISRTLPQLNILAIGFGVNALVTFGVLALSLGAAAWVFQDPLASAAQMLVDALNP